jgi:PTS system cellobiose-specific IIB component
MYILLVCSAGMSTSLLVNKMIESAKARGLDCKIDAHPVGQVGAVGPEADVILLGPQVRFELNNTRNKFPNKPVDVINMQDYGMMRGDKVLDQALKLLGK